MSCHGRSAWTHPRCEDQPFDPDHAATIGRVQATLIGAGRLAVAFACDAQSALLLTITARALGGDHVSLLLDPAQPPSPEADTLAHVVADSLGLPVLRTWGAAGLPRRELRDLPVDTIAFGEAVDGPAGRVPIRPVQRQRVLYPFAEAGLTTLEIMRCARSMGLADPRLPAASEAGA